MSSPYKAGKDFPTQSGQQYDNLIAYGIKVIALPKFRLRTTSSEYYQLYCDVYLYDDNNPGGPDGHYENAPEPPYFLYKYVYWYCKIEASGPTTYRPVDGTEKLLPTTKVKQVNGTDITVLNKCGSYDIPESINLRLTGFGNPAGWPATNAIPADFGWKPQIIDNIQTGTPENPVSTPVYGPAGFPASGGATKSSYYDRDGSTNETTINGGGDGDTQPDQGDRDNAPGDQNPPPPEQEPLPDINWFKAPTRWNPPLIGTATGAYVPVDLGDSVDELQPPTRRSILGPYGMGRRIGKKGYLRQYVVSAEDFRVNTQADTNVQSPDWDNNDAMIDLERGWVYGFRFHYNPAQVSMAALPLQSIDPAVVVSGLDQAFPVAADGAQISFPLYLNRIEDLSMLRKGIADNMMQKLYRGYSKKDRTLIFDEENGRQVGNEYWKEDLKGIRERGTGYDLEYLYRCAMGRPFPTALRGDTADLGVILGLPMQLKLSKHLNFIGRLTGLSYQHVMFNPEMVPMLTVVNIQFSRIPDAQSFQGAEE